MMTREQALDRLHGNDLLQLGMDADAARQALWPEGVVTYTVGYRLAIGGGVSWGEDVSAAVERGATGLVLSSLPGASLERVLGEVDSIHRRFPELTLSGFSSSEIAGFGRAEDVPAKLKQAGLAVFGNADGDAGADWIAVHRAAHRVGLPSIAMLLLRSSDSADDWVSLLEQVGELQAESQGFLACEPRIERMERTLDEVTGAHFLKMVALCRLYLEAVPHVQVNWETFGPKVLQVALRFGADDAGLVVASARDRSVPSHHSGEEELRRIIRDAGFQPSQRDALYGRQFVY
jgi:cyclic dehypoxanthinyl futalosine synthase